MTDDDRGLTQLLQVLFALRPDLGCFCGSVDQLRTAVAEPQDEELGR